MSGTWKQSWHDHGSLIVVVFAYYLVVSGVAVFGLDVPARELLQGVGYALMALLIAFSFWGVLLALAYGRAVCAAVRGGRRGFARRLHTIFDQIIHPYTTWPVLADTILGTMAIIGLSQFFVGKGLLPLLGDYHWDPVMIQLEEIVHGGRSAMDWLGGLYEYPWIIRAIDKIYILWFPVMFGTTSWVVFCDRNRVRRLQYLWVYCVSWMVIGTGLAIALASVGPIYLKDFYPDLPLNGYTAHLAALQAIHEQTPLRALDIAVTLKDLWGDETKLDMNAISAMPSMHVAVAWLLVLYGFAVRRWWVMAFMGAFFATIMVGSVVLGWHYAIDGYVSIAIITAMWAVTGWALRRKMGEKAGQKPEIQPVAPLDRAVQP